MKQFLRVGPEGEVPLSLSLALSNALQKHRGKDVVVSVERGRKRSLEENSFMHGPFIKEMLRMYEEFGTFDGTDIELTEGLVKETLKAKFGPRVIIDGTEVPIPSRQWTTSQCEKTMENARRFYAEFWQLPYPNEIPMEVYEQDGRR